MAICSSYIEIYRNTLLAYCYSSTMYIYNIEGFVRFCILMQIRLKSEVKKKRSYTNSKILKSEF